MAKTYHDQDADLSLIQAKKVAIIGYGSQGHAHALNLKDSGVESASACAPARRAKKAELRRPRGHAPSPKPRVGRHHHGARPRPDRREGLPGNRARPHRWPDGEPKTLMFAHGFNIRFRTITPPANVDVSLVAPKSPGHRVREVFTEGGGVPGLVAVEQDASGNALANALSYAKGIGCTRAGVLETTFTEETETDLFGEQAVLCGGTAALVKAGFEVLTEAGYQPELAYFEVLHELKLIVDLMYRGGLEYMRHSISDTAEWGDYVAGPRIVTADSQEGHAGAAQRHPGRRLRQEFIEDQNSGRKEFEELPHAGPRTPHRKSRRRPPHGHALPRPRQGRERQRRQSVSCFTNRRAPLSLFQVKARRAPLFPPRLLHMRSSKLAFLLLTLATTAPPKPRGKTSTSVSLPRRSPLHSRRAKLPRRNQRRRLAAIGQQLPAPAPRHALRASPPRRFPLHRRGRPHERRPLARHPLHGQNFASVGNEEALMLFAAAKLNRALTDKYGRPARPATTAPPTLPPSPSAPSPAPSTGTTPASPSSSTGSPAPRLFTSATRCSRPTSSAQGANSPN